MKMKIGVVGPGAIGLLYTFYLQKSNQDVTLFTRTAKQADELNITGVTCIREGKKGLMYSMQMSSLYENENWSCGTRSYRSIV
ncbi:2-dehydropantoate 2-reductase N-terminal domain-containing protein, partial [Bacillus anthracis]